MVGSRLGRYAIREQLGKGGMGVVFRATDLTLGRDVALKVLAREWTTDPDRLARFRHEARTASALNHPHVCTIHEIGEAGGIHFIVMEFVDGATLAREIAGGALEPARLLRLAVQIAEALAKAQEHGIVHRDLKPENILISRDGYAKLADFGVAKLREPRLPTLADTATHASTAAGAVVGTLNYMAPEQALGRPVDGRSDIFSFGLVLYEMATGERAVDAPTGVEVLFKIVNEPLAPARLARLPSGLAEVIGKATEKDPDNRYQSARELAVDLRRLLRAAAASPASGADAPPGRRRPSRLAAGAAIAAVAVLGAAAAWAWFGRADRPAPVTAAAADAAGTKRIAVLPFENVTGRPDDDWLSAAFSDSLTLALQPGRDFVLLSPEGITSVYRRFRAPETGRLDPRIVEQLGDRLGVGYYIHGTYQRLGDEVRVAARVIDVASATIVGQESLTDSMANLLRMQAELARRFAAKLSPGSVDAAQAETTSVAGYRALSDARAMYAAGRWLDGLEASRRATRLEPQSAAAWAILAKTAARLTAPSVFTGGNFDDYRRLARDAAERAVSLGPHLYETHVAHALVLRDAGDIARWRDAARRAIGINPRQAEAYALLADSFNVAPSWGCAREHDAPMAESLYRQALRLDPGLHSVHRNFVGLLTLSGRLPEAIEHASEAYRAYPDSAPLRRAYVFALAHAGRWDEAERALREPGAAQTLEERATLAVADLRRGRIDAAEAEFRKVLEHGFPELRLYIAAHCVAAGQREAARRYVAEMIRLQPACADFIATTTSPFFARLRELD